MPDVPIKPEPEPEPDHLADAIAEVERRYRVIVTGDENGRVRRKTLYAIAAVCILVGLVIDGIFGLLSATTALVALLLLAMNDDVVPL